VKNHSHTACIHKSELRNRMVRLACIGIWGVTLLGATVANDARAETPETAPTAPTGEPTTALPTPETPPPAEAPTAEPESPATEPDPPPSDMARKAEPPVTSELTYLSFNVIRLNPLGLQSQFDLDWKVRLYDPGDSLLKSNNFASIGVSPMISPALSRLGISAKLQPLAILKLEVRWDYLAWFGNFDLLQSWTDANVDFSDTAIKQGGDEGRNYAADGWQVTFDIEARAKVGPMIVRNRFRAAYLDVALRGDDRVFYDQYFDLLLPRQGWFFTNDADLLFQVTPELIMGVRWAFMGVEYTADNFTTSTGTNTNSQPMHRFGPLVAYTFFDEPGASFNKPTILLMLNWHLVHPSRTGQDVSQAIPYTVLGFAFSGRLLP
jgi:hypothetical protein